MRAAVIAGLFIAGVCIVCTAEEPLRNPGFETGDFAGWDTRGQGWSISDQAPSKGLRYAVCAVKKGEARGSRVCMQKIGTVQEGKIVEVSLDVAATDVVRSPNSKACIAVLCTDSKGGVRKEYRSGIDRPSSAFEQVEIDDAIVLPGTAEIYIMIVVEVYQTALDDDWWRFDNVTVRIR
jgi:hypothetical protein